MKTNITNTFSISTTFTADGGTITKTTRVLDGGKVTLVQVFGRGGKVEHAEYLVVTPSFRGVIHSDLVGAERFVSAKGREIAETPARVAALVALITEARIAA